VAKKGLCNRKMGYGRNDLCPCGSGKKYKKCCKPVYRMKTDEELQAEIDERKKSCGVAAEKYMAYVQALGRMNMRDKIRVDYGDLPERVSVDE